MARARARGLSMTASGAGCDSAPGSTVPGAAKAAPPSHGASARNKTAESKTRPRDIQSRIPSEIHCKYPALRGGPRDAVPAARLHRLPDRPVGATSAGPRRDRSSARPPTEGEPVHAWRKKPHQRLCPALRPAPTVVSNCFCRRGFACRMFGSSRCRSKAGNSSSTSPMSGRSNGAMSKQRAVEEMWSGRTRYYVVLPTGRVDVAPVPARGPNLVTAFFGRRRPGRPRVAARREHEGRSPDPAPAAEPDPAAAQPGDGQPQRVLSRGAPGRRAQGDSRRVPITGAGTTRPKRPPPRRSRRRPPAPAPAPRTPRRASR